MENLISVILPVYNAEKYLQNAIQSVFKQSYKNWELIMIDDGSTDETLRICTFYQKKGNVIVIRPEKHLGVGGIRNIGIAAAQGKYIVFLDADDMLTTDSLMERVRVMEEHSLDMGIFNYRINVEGRKPEKRNLTALGVYEGADFFKRTAYFGSGRSLGMDSVWDKMFRRALIREREIKFREDWNMCEDSVFCLDYAMACEGKIEVVDKCVYEYYRRKAEKNSLTEKFFTKGFCEVHDVLRNYFQILHTCLLKKGIFDETAIEGMYHGYVNRIIGALYSCPLNDEIGILFEDRDFLTGIESYKCTTSMEDPEIIRILRKKNVEELLVYIKYHGIA